jgi:hypothetical protein
MQKGSVAFICIFFALTAPVECAVFRSPAEVNFLEVDHQEEIHPPTEGLLEVEQESEQELEQLRLAAVKLQAFCRVTQNMTEVPRGWTGIASDAIADPHCTEGVVSPDLKVCCAKECGSCGNHKLCGDPGKYNEATGLLVDQCCYGRIMKRAPSCDKDHPPCALSPAYKETLKKWTQDIPARHAMQDCNSAIPKARNSHDHAIDKGEFLAELYLKGETKYKDALRIAQDVYHKCDEKIAEGDEKAADAAAKVAGANAADEVKNPLTGKSPKMKWEHEEQQGKSESDFYKQIKTNAKRIVDEAKLGVGKVKMLHAEAQKVKDVTPLQNDLNTLIVDAEEVYQEALKLWQQWKDSSKDYDCGAPPPVKNAESMCKNGNTKFSTECQIKCAPGYDGNGTMNHLSCDKVGKFGEELTGEWNGMAACAGRECGVPPHIKHAKTMLAVIRYPDAATYNCLEGFITPGGAHSFNVPCDTDGFFNSNSSHICKGVVCGAAPVLPGTLPVKGTFHYSEEANYSCMKGYTLDGLPGGRTYFHTACQATGQFSHGNMGCKKVRCGPVPNFANTKVTHLTTADEADQHYGDKADYTCEPGYTLDTQPKGPTKFTLSCHADGEFSLEGSDGDSAMHQPRCKPICIGEPPKIAHAVYSSHVMCFGDTIVVSAEIGYSTVPSPTEGLSFTIGVSSDGHFTGIETLLPVECGALPEAKHSKTTFSKKVAVFEDVVEYECEAGYSTDKTKAPGAKSFQISCQFDGTFSPLPSLGGCANIDDCTGHTCGAHGSCVDHLMNYTCSCSSGYGMTWNKQAKQLSCGNIDNCGPEACGVGKCIDELNAYKCDCPTGYEQVTEMTGAKSDHTCRAVSCGTPEAVEHSFITPVELALAKASYGMSLLYVCEPGYTTDGKLNGIGEFSATCEADKKFGNMETCTAITCDKLPNVKNAVASGGAVTFNESVVFSCATGYSVDGTGDGEKSFTVTCQSTGAYSEPGMCERISCGEPPDSAHASHSAQEKFFEDKVEYECFSGFTLDGVKDGATTFEVECKADGSFSTMKQCLPKICGELTPGDFENAVFKNEGEIHYPMATEITCKDGYTTDATADGNKTFTVSCLASGDFEKFDPKACKNVKCGTPPPAPNSSVKDGKMTMVFGDIVEYSCLVGFTVGGEQGAPMTYDVECQGNGGFSSPSPDMICKNVNDCEGHTCGPFGTCVDLIGPAPAYTCDCQYGYIIKTDANGEKHCGEKDECKGADCGMGVCKDLIGSYTCICPGGYYVGVGDDGKKNMCSCDVQ